MCLGCDAKHSLIILLLFPELFIGTTNIFPTTYDRSMADDANANVPLFIILPAAQGRQFPELFVDTAKAQEYAEQQKKFYTKIFTPVLEKVLCVDV